MSRDFDLRFLELRVQHLELIEELERIESLPAPTRLERLDQLLKQQRSIGDATRSLRNRLRRHLHATTERERVEALRTGEEARPDDIALAILRGAWTIARDALAMATGPFGPVAKTVAKDVTRMIEGGVAIKNVESAVQRIERAEDRELLGTSLRGALLLQLGRLYRDELRSTNMALSAFRRAGEALQDQPEPLTERAELLRRAGRLDPAQELFTHATKLAPQRAGAWVGLALVASARSAWDDCAEHARRAIDIVRLDPEPLDVLKRVQPAPCSAVFLALARQLRDHDIPTAQLAYDAAIRECADPTTETLPTLYRERAELSSPPDPNGFCEAGRLALHRGDYELAIELLRKALQLRPGFRPAYAYLADAYRLRAGEGHDKELQIQDLRHGLASSWEAITSGPLVPGDAWILLIHTRIYEALIEVGKMSDEAFFEALRHCEHALVLEPANASCLARAARLHYQVGNRVTAKYSAERAERLAPNNLDAIGTLYWLSVVSGDYDRAAELAQRLPDSNWRRGVEAHMRSRQRTDRASLELALSLVAMPKNADVVTRSWMPIVAGHCLRLLGDEDGARREFEAALDSTRLIDRIEASLALGRYLTVIELCEAEKEHIRYRTDDDLVGCLTIAYLATGQLERASDAFSRLCRLVRGPSARNWRVTFERDLELHPAFQHAPPDVAALRHAYCEALGELADAGEKRSPRGEIDRVLESTNLLRIPREALRLARVRIAIDGDVGSSTANLGSAELVRAVHLVESLEQSIEKADALCRVSAWCAATAAELDERGLVEISLHVTPETRSRVFDFVTNARQAARLFAADESLWREHSAANWLERHLGLDAPAVETGIPPIVVSIPERLVPAIEQQGTWPFITKTIPAVRKAMEDWFGVLIPRVHVYRAPNSTECGVWVNEDRVAKVTVDTSESFCTDDNTDIAELAHTLVPGDSWSKASGISQHTYIGAWLIQQLSDHLATLIGPHELVQWAEEWSESDRDSRVLTDTGSLLRLWRLVRGLLREHVPPKPRAQVASAARRGRSLTHEAFLNHARRFVYLGLCEELYRRRESQIARVPISVEEAVLARVRHDGKRAYLAMPHREASNILATLRPAIAGTTRAILRVTESEVRPWIQQLVALEWPDAIVISATEQKQYMRWLDGRAGKGS